MRRSRRPPRCRRPMNYAYVGHLHAERRRHLPISGGPGVRRADAIAGLRRHFEIHPGSPSTRRRLACMRSARSNTSRECAAARWSRTRSTARVCKIKRLGAVSSAGTTPTYASVHPSDKFVFVANYGGRQTSPFSPWVLTARSASLRTSDRAWAHAIAPARLTIRPGNSRSAIMIVRMCTWSRRTRTGSSSLRTMRDWI